MDRKPPIDTDRIDDAVLALLLLGLCERDRISGLARAWKSFDWAAMLDQRPNVCPRAFINAYDDLCAGRVDEHRLMDDLTIKGSLIGHAYRQGGLHRQ